MRGTAEDPEVVELDIQFSGLSITVRGPPSTAASFLQQVTTGQHDQASDQRPVPSSAPYLASPAPRASSSEERPRAFGRPGPTYARTGETRASVEASFPPCPATWIGAASSRLSGSRLSSLERAHRAWKAGQWARAVRQGRVSSPNRTESIDLPNRVWCVVRGPQGGDPKVFHSSPDFFTYVGDLSQSHTLCHAWPSETEAKIYFEGAETEAKISSTRQDGGFWEIRLARGIHCSCAGVTSERDPRGRRQSGSGFGYFEETRWTSPMRTSWLLFRGDLGHGADSFGRRSGGPVNRPGEVEDLAGKDPPVQASDATVDVVLVDVTRDVWDHLSPFDPGVHSIDMIHTFNSERAHQLPMVDAITAAAWTWISDPGSGERVGFYSALEEEFPSTPRTPRPRNAKAKAAPGTGGGEPGGETKPDANKPRPTVNSLASSLESMSQTLPQIMEEIRMLRQRTEVMEGQLATNPSRPGCLPHRRG